MTTLSDHVIYKRTAPVLIVLCFILAIGAVVGTYVNDQNDRERDRAIDRVQSRALQDNQALLQCFDEFATDLAGGLPPVREATAQRDAAVGAAFEAIRAALVNLSGDGSQIPAVIQALDAVRTATRHLIEVRADNPYPAPPSEFCATSD